MKELIERELFHVGLRLGQQSRWWDNINSALVYRCHQQNSTNQNILVAVGNVWIKGMFNNYMMLFCTIFYPLPFRNAV